MRGGGSMTLREDVRRNRDAILAIAREHGASRVRIFGSVARGTERPDSDIDLLVHAESASLFDLAAMEEKLEAIFGRRVQVVSDGGLKSSVRDMILREAVAV